MSNRMKLLSFLLPKITTCKENSDLICEFLSQVYKTVNNRSNKKFDFYILQELTNLPLFVCEKLFLFFQTIQQDKQHYLKESEFINGIYGIMFSSFENRIFDCFEIYDFDRDGIIHKNDVSLLLYQFHLQNNSSNKILLLDKVINVFFTKNDEMNKREFISKCQKDNCDIALLLIIFIKEFGSFFTEKEINFYSKLCSKKQRKLSLCFSYEIIKKSKVFHPTKALLEYLDNIDLQLCKSENDCENSFSSIETVNEENSDDSSLLSDEEPLSDLHNFEHDIQQAIKTSFNISNEKDIFLAQNTKYETIVYSKRDFKSKTKSSDFTQWLSTCAMTNSVSPTRDNTVMPTNGINPLSKYFSFTKEDTVLKQNELICYKMKDGVPFGQYRLKIVGKFVFFFRFVNEMFLFTKLLPISSLYYKITNASKEKIQFSMYSTMHHYTRSMDFTVSNRNHWDVFISTFKNKENKERIFDLFEIKKELGKGKFGKVFLVQNKSNLCFYAIKEIEKVSKEEEYKVARWELAITHILKNLNHDNIVKAYSVYESLHKLYFVYEYIEGKDLRDEFLNERNIQKVYKTTFALFNAITFLHKFGIVHRDLKTLNILMKNNPYNNTKSLKIIDFGLSRIIGYKEKSTDPYGSLCFQSPEILLRVPYNSKVDIWAMGITIFYLLYGELPFGGQSKSQIREFIIQDRIPFILEQHDYACSVNSISNEDDEMLIEKKLRLIIKVCLEKNIYTRPSAQMIIDQFFVNIN